MFERLVCALVSAIALGTLCGWLTGRSVPEATVTAAAIPAILSIAGTFLFWRSLSSEGTHTGGYATVFIVAFSTTFAWGLVRASDSRDAAVERSVLTAMEQRIELAFRCSDAVMFLNEDRSQHGQPPLSFRDVCSFGQ